MAVVPTSNGLVVSGLYIMKPLASVPSEKQVLAVDKEVVKKPLYGVAC